MRKPLNAVLGPVPCQTCRTPVWWARGQRWWRYGESHAGLLWWREDNGHAHVCEGLPRAYRKRAA